MLTAANVHDSKVLEELVDGIEPIRHPGRGRPRKRPEKLHADKGYDFPRCRKTLRKRGIKARIARRGVDTSERLGRHRWVAKRTLAWLGLGTGDFRWATSGVRTFTKPSSISAARSPASTACREVCKEL